MEIKKVCVLDQIITKADNQQQKDITCTRCKGHKKLDCYKEIQRGVCYKCGGSGIIPNKWKAIKAKAVELKEAKTWLREFYKQEYQDAVKDSRKASIMETYQMRLNSLKVTAYSLAEEAGIKN